LAICPHRDRILKVIDHNGAEAVAAVCDLVTGVCIGVTPFTVSKICTQAGLKHLCETGTDHEHKEFAAVEMSGEYARFLAEKALSEDRILPVLKDRTIFRDPVFLAYLAELIASLPKANKHELEKIKGFLDGIVPGCNTNWLLRFLNQQLLAELRVAKISLPSGILDVGVFPLETFNARIVRRPSGFLVLIDTGAFEILELCAGLGVIERATYDERGKELEKCVVAYCKPTRGLPGTSPLVQAEWKKIPTLICAATTWAERFLLAHEYGHHVLGHLRTSRQEMCRTASSQFDVNVFEHVHEYEADIWALWALLRSARAAPGNANVVGFACASPFYFLATLALIEGIWRTKGYQPKSHPPAVNRILNLERCLSVWGLLNENSFLWTHFGRIAEAASHSLFGHELIPAVPDKRLLRDLALISNPLLSELRL
jgi:hypothetical protein